MGRSTRRSPGAILGRIGHQSPGWDHDLHIHTNWSQDNLTGPTFFDYLVRADRYRIHLGFTEHFEWAHYEQTNPKMGIWKLTPATIDHYLEECDRAREQYPHCSIGLELDFYPSRIDPLVQFMDRYANQFDYFLGSLHELRDFYPVTVLKDLEFLVKELGGIGPVLDQYYHMLGGMIESQIFDAVAHPDVIYRFYSPVDRQREPLLNDDPRVLEIGYQCASTRTLLEINLSGLRSPWARPFPAENVIPHLRAHGVTFFVGSDSHSVEAFEQSVLNIRKFNNILRERI
jgi:HisJ family histidinol phosphate phosphatase